MEDPSVASGEALVILWNNLGKQLLLEGQIGKCG